MKTTSINRSLVIGLGAILAFFAIQALAVLAMGRYAEREVVEVARRNTSAQVNLAKLSTLAQQIRRYEKEYFIYVEVADKRTQYHKEWTDTMAQIKTLLGAMHANADGAFSGDDGREIAKWTGAAEFYAGEMNKIFAEVDARAKQAAEEEAARSQAAAPTAAKSPKTAKEAVPPSPVTRMLLPIEANDMIKAGKDRFSGELIKGVTEMFRAKSQATLALTSVTNEGFEKLIYAIVATVLIGIAIGLYLLVTLPRTVTRPIAQLTGNVDAISRGDTTQAGAAVSVREFQGLSAAIERMRVAQEIMLQRLRKPG